MVRGKALRRCYGTPCFHWQGTHPLGRRPFVSPLPLCGLRCWLSWGLWDLSSPETRPSLLLAKPDRLHKLTLTAPSLVRNRSARPCKMGIFSLEGTGAHLSQSRCAARSKNRAARSLIALCHRAHVWACVKALPVMCEWGAALCPVQAKSWQDF